MLLFINSEGRTAGRGKSDGFMGQFAFTRAPAQITAALIRLSKWGAHNPRVPATYDQTSLCLYSLVFFTRHLFWRPISKTWRFLKRPKYITMDTYRVDRGRFRASFVWFYVFLYIHYTDLIIFIFFNLK